MKRQKKAPVNRSIALVISVILDIIGYASYAVFWWGEYTDLLFFLIQAGWIRYAYQSTPLAIFGGIEELLPFTDFLPANLIAHWHTRPKK